MQCSQSLHVRWEKPLKMAAHAVSICWSVNCTSLENQKVTTIPSPATNFLSRSAINYQRVLVSFQTAILLLFFVSCMKQHYVALEVGSIRKHISSWSNRFLPAHLALRELAKVSSANSPKAPCCFPVAQSPNEGRCSINKADIASAAWCALPPIAPELHHTAGCNTPIPATPKPTGKALPHFRRPTFQWESLSHPQGGRCWCCAARIAAESRNAAGCTPPALANPNPMGNTLQRFCRPTSKRGPLSCPQDGSSHLPTPSPPLNRSAHQASATCVRQFLPEELVAL